MSKKEFPEVLISGNVRQNRLAGGRGGRQGKNCIKDDNKVKYFFNVSQNCKKSYLLKGEFSGTSIAYIYPGMKMAIRGKFKDEKLGL